MDLKYSVRSALGLESAKSTTDLIEAINDGNAITFDLDKSELTLALMDLDNAIDALTNITNVYNTFTARQENEEKITSAELCAYNMAIEIASRYDNELVPGESLSLENEKSFLDKAKEKLSKAIKAVKGFISGIGSKVSGFFKRWFTMAGRLKATFQKIKAEATKVSGDPKEDKLMLKAPMLQMTGKKEVPYKDVVGLLEQFSKVDLSKALTDIEKALELPKGDTFSLDAYTAKVLTMIDKATTDALKSIYGLKETTKSDAKSKGIVTKGDKPLLSDELPGGHYFVLDRANSAYLTGTARSTGLKKSNKFEPVKMEVSTLSKAEVIEICDRSIAAMENVAKLSKNFEKFLDSASALFKNQLENDVDDLGWLDASTYTSMFRMIINYTFGLVESNATFCGNLSKGLVSYSKSSLSKYDKE